MTNSLVDVSDTERKLAESVNADIARNLAISDRAGGVAFVSMLEVMNFAKLMALSGIAIPKHLRGSPGACLGVCIQALEWQMSPYAVANKSYEVNNRLAYEAQLIVAVIMRRSPIKGRLQHAYDGEGQTRRCKIWAELRDSDQIVEYESPIISRISPQNSPLWKSDPDQQLYYYSSRASCRRHFPDVLLGVYSRDELEDAEPLAAAVAITNRPNLASKLDALGADPETGEIIEAKANSNSDAQPNPPSTAASDEAGAGESSPPASADASAKAAASAMEKIYPAAEAPSEPVGGDPGPSPSQPSPVAIARQRGAQARRDGFARKKVPEEYKTDERVAEADAWLEAWIDEHRRLTPGHKIGEAQ